MKQLFESNRRGREQKARTCFDILILLGVKVTNAESLHRKALDFAEEKGVISEMGQLLSQRYQVPKTVVKRTIQEVKNATFKNQS